LKGGTVHIAELIGKAKQFTSNHSTLLLTGAGSAGVVGTSYLSHQAGYKAARLIHKESLNLSPVRDDDRTPRTIGNDFTGLPDLTFREKIKLVYPLYVPPFITGAGTLAAILTGNRVASNQIAALTIASSVSEKALQEYKAKVVEKLGENKELSVREALAQDKVDKVPVNTREVILAGTGEVLCFDIYSGRYFQSSVEEIKKAENTINFNIINHSYASLSSLYDEIGLPPTGVSDEVGWNLDNQLTIAFSTTMSSDGRPCIAVDFGAHPQPNYNKFY
jgi:hypothetical protein